MGIKYWEVVRMKKMKRVIVAATVMASLVTVTPVMASIDQVNEYLADYSSDTISFYAEEYCGENVSCLFVRVSLPREESLDYVKQSHEMLRNMAYQDWFDYNDIYSLVFASDSGRLLLDVTYDVDNGTETSNMGTNLFPWLIKNGDDLDSDTKKFIGRTAEELMQYNINPMVNLGIGTGGENSLEIKECDGLAEVRGDFSYDGKDYSFITQFTYSNTDEYTGTYETRYVSVNNIDMVGEYNEFTNTYIRSLY